MLDTSLTEDVHPGDGQTEGRTPHQKREGLRGGGVGGWELNVSDSCLMDNCDGAIGRKTLGFGALFSPLL